MLAIMYKGRTYLQWLIIIRINGSTHIIPEKQGRIPVGMTPTVYNATERTITPSNGRWRPRDNDRASFMGVCIAPAHGQRIDADLLWIRPTENTTCHHFIQSGMPSF